MSGLKKNCQALMLKDISCILLSMLYAYLSLIIDMMLCALLYVTGVSSPQGFWSPEHTVQFSEMVEEQSFSATFKSELHEQGCVIYKVELVDKKGTNVNEKFGAMTGTSCPETMSGPFSRSVSHFKPGDDMKITVSRVDRIITFYYIC